MKKIKTKQVISVQYKYIPGYEGKYQVNTLGEVIRLPDKGNVKLKTLKPYSYGIGGNYYIGLNENGNRKRYIVGYLVAREFIKNPNGYKYIGHLDGNKENNKVNNLFWTNKDNHRGKKYSKDILRLLNFSEWYADKENRKEKSVEDWYSDFIIENK